MTYILGRFRFPFVRLVAPTPRAAADLGAVLDGQRADVVGPWFVLVSTRLSLDAIVVRGEAVGEKRGTWGDADAINVVEKVGRRRRERRRGVRERWTREEQQRDHRSCASRW